MTRIPSILMTTAACVSFMLPQLLLAGDDETSALQKEVSKFAAGGTLDQVLAQVSESCGLKIVTDWPALQACGVKKDARIAFAAPKATTEQLLDMALARAATEDQPLGWYVSAKVIHVTSQARVLCRQTFQAADLPTPASAPKAKDPPQVQFTFDKLPLNDVITFFRETTKVNMDVNWKSLEGVGVTKTTPVTLQIKDVTPARALDMVLAQISGNGDKFERVYWVISDGVVTIATGNALNQDLKTRVFDVMDLLVVVPEFKGPRLQTSINNNNNSSTNGDKGNTLWPNQDNTSSDKSNTPSMTEQRAKVKDALIAAVKNSIGEDMWKPDGKGSISIVNGKMLIAQTALGYKLMESAGAKR